MSVFPLYAIYVTMIPLHFFVNLHRPVLIQLVTVVNATFFAILSLLFFALVGNGFVRGANEDPFLASRGQMSVYW